MKNKMLSECISIARNKIEKHPMDKFIHFTFIVQGKKILGFGTNRYGPAPTGFGYDENSEIHSEPDAFHKYGNKIDKTKPFKVVNIRFNKLGEIKMSKPCKCCNGFLKVMGANTVWFTTDAGWAKMDL